RGVGHPRGEGSHRVHRPRGFGALPISPSALGRHRDAGGVPRPMLSTCRPLMTEPFLLREISNHRGRFNSMAGDAAEIRRLGVLAREAGLSLLSDEGERLAERASVGGYYVACLGQFKRGKSSLLNSLLGRLVLPTGVAPVTSVATVVRFGPQPRARVRFVEGWQEISPSALAEYVTEARNPSNKKGALAVEVFDPSPLLAEGMCLVDTPGISSVVVEN